MYRTWFLINCRRIKLQTNNDDKKLKKNDSEVYVTRFGNETCESVSEFSANIHWFNYFACQQIVSWGIIEYFWTTFFNRELIKKTITVIYSYFLLLQLCWKVFYSLSGRVAFLFIQTCSSSVITCQRKEVGGYKNAANF